MLEPLLTGAFATALRSIPVLAKYLAVLLVLANVRSIPLAWHFRVFRPVFAIRIRYRLLRWSIMFKPKKVQDVAEDRWLDSITPIGANPFTMVVPYRSWASIDDSDFNGHLSNSSYAKTLDAARFKCALEMFPLTFRAGSWMPLAETHYHFIREIPMLSKYEVRVSIGGWDQKWIYVVSKFVTKPKGKQPKKVTAKSESPQPEPTTENLFHPSLRTPASNDVSSAPTPLPHSTTSAETSTDLKTVAANLASKEEPDGAVLHTVCVSLVCFKMGRITVPPTLALAINGFSVPPSSDGEVAAYSRTNPPPHWAKAKAVWSKPQGGSTKALAALLKGGWRDVSESERWWDQALSGSLDEKRKENMAGLEALRKGMDAARISTL
ncbi:hypothetical protein BDQ12DRAFT_667169 [Crucibulum laeve]|uniref:Thioesterase-like superfamily-domain-containing protein n=1 Tax=Crucibulum laeve TaxID=68775 RepID=A0A5C3M7T5_9AGAR|nr:hypothetical protein BDQ12DRAFT_667169 [Crucibulum laeve]